MDNHMENPPEGHWVTDGKGMHFEPHGLDRTADLVTDLAYKVRGWVLHGKTFTDGKEACLLGGRLLIFYKGVKVVKQNDKYFILYWGGNN